MGKTLASYFFNQNDLEISQLYFHSEIPTTTLCSNYYRITDPEVARSIFTRKSGKIFTKNDIVEASTSPRTDTGTIGKIYQSARKRTPLVYLIRNTWWNLGKWKTKELYGWLDKMAPDAVFFASGDYSFAYKVALHIAKKRNIPLFVSCMDDYYFWNKNGGSLLGRIVHKAFMKQVRKTMSYASGIFTICEKMTADYSALFAKPCYTIHTSSSISEKLVEEKSNAISYIGNLGYSRHEQLINLGKALKSINHCNNPGYIDVYSTESRDEILKTLTKENGIRFHGAISVNEVLRVIGQSQAVIHTESFDKSIRKSVAYSVSTKIADSLASGTCIIAYGPEEVASIKYLSENNAAFCIGENDCIEEKLYAFFESSSIKESIVENALSLAKKNHNPAERSEKFKNILLKANCPYNENSAN